MSQGARLYMSCMCVYCGLTIKVMDVNVLMVLETRKQRRISFCMKFGYFIKRWVSAVKEHEITNSATTSYLSVKRDRNLI